jgi:PAS domain S-box-containing protein
MSTSSDAPRLTLAEYAAMLDHLHEGVFLMQAGVFRYVNRAVATMAGGQPEDIIGRPLLYMIAPEDHAIVADRYRRRAAGEAVSDTYEFSVLCLDRATRIPVFMQTRAYPGADGIVSVGSIVTLTHRAALAAVMDDHLALTDPDAAAERLAIPVLQLHPHALVVPLVGRVTAARAGHLMDRVLSAISEHRARELILDITGVPHVDERVAAYLVRTAAAVRLLGARLTLAGISPTVAHTLVTIGADLRTLDTTASLQDAWQSASRRLA